MKIKEYINQSWDRLTRTSFDAIRDPKLNQSNDPLYFPNSETIPKFENIEVRYLPKDPQTLKQHGLLYLPHPYVSPGGRFNEMYGWDSYFILMGLLFSGKIGLAKGIVRNFLYEVEKYGFLLNSNRTYHLTRSHPPFLTQMVLLLFKDSIEELKEMYPLLVTYYQFWTGLPRFVKETGLSRYFDHGFGPAPEVLTSEVDSLGKNHYERLQDEVLSKRLTVTENSFDFKAMKWKEGYYKSDRAMRESGFDVSSVFGPYGIETTNLVPVCLNSLLAIMENDLSSIASQLGKMEEGEKWQRMRQLRIEKINAFCWKEDEGLYTSYNYATQKQNSYPFLTTFYPLWAKIASSSQAEKVKKNLPLFERDGGLMTSTLTSGCQWDAPFGWAPLHYIAVRGLLNYGFYEDAMRIANKFTNLIRQEYTKTGCIFEKYNVVKQTAEIDHSLNFGYLSNEIGFGWTNGVYLALTRKINTLYCDNNFF